MNYKRLYMLMLAVILCFGLYGCGEAKEVEDQINALGEITLDSMDALDEIARSYAELTESQRKQVKNYALYEQAVEEYDELVYANIDEIFLDLRLTKYNEKDNLIKGLNKYKKYLTEDQQDLLLASYYFFEDGPIYVQNYIQSRLKSPRSFYVYNMDVDYYTFYVEDNKEYNNSIKITYGATNSFGAEVTKTKTFLIDFRLNSDKQGITVTDALIY